MHLSTEDQNLSLLLVTVKHSQLSVSHVSCPPINTNQIVLASEILRMKVSLITTLTAKHKKCENYICDPV